MSTHNLCFEQKYEKYQNFIWKFSVFGGEIFNIFELACFRNVYRCTADVFIGLVGFSSSGFLPVSVYPDDALSYDEAQ